MGTTALGFLTIEQGWKPPWATLKWDVTSKAVGTKLMTACFLEWGWPILEIEPENQSSEPTLPTVTMQWDMWLTTLQLWRHWHNALPTPVGQQISSTYTVLGNVVQDAHPLPYLLFMRPHPLWEHGTVSRQRKSLLVFSWTSGEDTKDFLDYWGTFNVILFYKFPKNQR